MFISGGSYCASAQSSVVTGKIYVVFHDEYYHVVLLDICISALCLNRPMLGQFLLFGSFFAAQSPRWRDGKHMPSRIFLRQWLILAHSMPCWHLQSTDRYVTVLRTFSILIRIYCLLRVIYAKCGPGASSLAQCLPCLAGGYCNATGSMYASRALHVCYHSCFPSFLNIPTKFFLIKLV